MKIHMTEEPLKIYIAGKITGNKNAREQFKAVEKDLVLAGHKVINPSVLPDGFEHQEYMHICFSMLDICEAIYLQKNWRDSAGACMEYGYAKAKGKKIIEET